jgi:hypothetical protein
MNPQAALQEACHARDARFRKARAVHESGTVESRPFPAYPPFWRRHAGNRAQMRSVAEVAERGTLTAQESLFEGRKPQRLSRGARK